ncbi:hypothetical protein QTG54_007231 [Skeletonema marinoi]|uniref:Uncharacterized protein n=2 Tax=Skeletonema marinoi TaxID=267567 RepID=A0AAD9DDH5_9STRA|nr:hypothetical protein QTG54_007231 [Skeletonema marinoi]
MNLQKIFAHKKSSIETQIQIALPLLNMAFGSASPDSGVDPRPPALNLTSWDDMCTEGGITFIIFLTILALYMIKRRCLAKEWDRTVTSPFYSKSEEQDQSRFFPRVIEKIEDIFILPLVPRDLDSFVMWIFFWFFITTIPMAINRYYKKSWENDVFALQGPLNLISHLFGCGMLNTTSIPYTEVLEENPPPLFSLPPKSAKYERIDWFLFFHLSIGLLWLCAAFLQIYKHKVGGWSFEREEHWKTHRWFGKVSLLIAILHTLMMTYITLENPVNQDFMITVGYLGMVIQSVILLQRGFKFASLTARSTGDEKKRFKKLHEMSMFQLYVKTIRGSGTIRISAWLLRLVGQFLSPDTRDIIDRSCCQTYAEHIGDASACWKPVFLNHFTMNFINDWLELLYIHMKIHDVDGKAVEATVRREKQKIWLKFFVRVIGIIPTFPLIIFDDSIRQWSLNFPQPFQFIIGNLATIFTYVMILLLFYIDLVFDTFPKFEASIQGFLQPDDEPVAVKED